MKLFTFHIQVYVFGSIGPAHLIARDNIKPGISRLFPLRLMLRVGEMLQMIKRTGLPGVLAAEKVKTTGTKTWKPIVVSRIVTTTPAAVYGLMGAHSLLTLVEGSKGRSAEKVAEDLRDVNCLMPYTVQPSEEYKEQLAGQCATLLAECRQRLRGAPRQRKAKAAPVSSALPAPATPTAAIDDVEPEVADTDTVMVDLQPQEEAPPAAVDEATSSNVADVPLQAEPSFGDSSSDCDSRSLRTDDSFSDSHSDTASTDPFGFSPDHANLADSDDDAVPPRACSSTDSD